MSDNVRQVLNKSNLGISAGLPLEASAEGIDELRANIQHLMDIEAIKQLKHAYFSLYRYRQTLKNWVPCSTTMFW